MTAKKETTTVLIAKETAKDIDEYLSSNPQYQPLGRSGFIAAAVEYFKRTGADLHGDYSVVSKSDAQINELVEMVKTFSKRNEEQIAQQYQQNRQMFFSLVSSKAIGMGDDLVPEVRQAADNVKKTIELESELAETKKRLESANKELQRLKREINRIGRSIIVEY